MFLFLFPQRLPFFFRRYRVHRSSFNTYGTLEERIDLKRYGTDIMRVATQKTRLYLDCSLCLFLFLVTLYNIMYLLFKNREDLHRTIQSDWCVPAHILLRNLFSFGSCKAQTCICVVSTSSTGASGPFFCFRSRLRWRRRRRFSCWLFLRLCAK